MVVTEIESIQGFEIDLSFGTIYLGYIQYQLILMLPSQIVIGC